MSPACRDGDSASWKSEISHGVVLHNATIAVDVSFTLAPQHDFTEYSVLLVDKESNSAIERVNVKADPQQSEATVTFRDVPTEKTYVIQILPEPGNKNDKCLCYGFPDQPCRKSRSNEFFVEGLTTVPTTASFLSQSTRLTTSPTTSSNVRVPAHMPSDNNLDLTTEATIGIALGCLFLVALVASRIAVVMRHRVFHSCRKRSQRQPSEVASINSGPNIASLMDTDDLTLRETNGRFHYFAEFIPPTECGASVGSKPISTMMREINFPEYPSTRGDGDRETLDEDCPTLYKQDVGSEDIISERSEKDSDSNASIEV